MRSLTATADGAGKINLSWDEPTTDNGSEIAKYCIVANRINDSNAAAVVATGHEDRIDTADGTGRTHELHEAGRSCHLPLHPQLTG